MKTYNHKTSDYFTKRIVIVEDNVALKDGYALILNSIKNYFIVNTYTNCEDALRMLHSDKPDLILMDLELPGMNGIEGIKEVKKRLPNVAILVVTVYENSDLVFNALCAGAIGYITKNSNHVELLDALEELFEGGAPMSSHIAKMVVQSFQRNQASPLSKRETDVLTLIAKGKTYAEIADDLFVSHDTAKSHIKNIYSKLQVHKKSEAIAKAKDEKLI